MLWVICFFETGVDREPLERRVSRSGGSEADYSSSTAVLKPTSRSGQALRLPQLRRNWIWGLLDRRPAFYGENSRPRRAFVPAVIDGAFSRTSGPRLRAERGQSTRDNRVGQHAGAGTVLVLG
jgi:hypothetical protein